MKAIIVLMVLAFGVVNGNSWGDKLEIYGK